MATLQQQFQADIPGAATAPVVTTDGLFTTSGVTRGASVFGLDATDGLRNWEAPIDTVPGSAFSMSNAFADSANHRVLVGYGYANIGGHYSATWFDAKTGAATPAPVATIVGTARFPDYAGVFTAFGSGGPFAVFLEGTNVSVPVLFSSSGTSLAVSDPTLGVGVVFVGVGSDERAYATPMSCSLNQYPCPTRWTTTLDGHPTAPVISDDGSTVYVGTDAGTAYALNATTGAVRWSVPLGSAVAESPSLANGVLYFPTATGNLTAVSAADGSQQWTASTGSSITVQPAVAGGVVYTGSTDGTVDAFNAAGCGAATCSPLWTHNVGGTVNGGLAVAFGRLYVGGASGMFGFAPS